MKTARGRDNPLHSIERILYAWIHYQGESIRLGQLAIRLQDFWRLDSKQVLKAKVGDKWEELDGFVVGAPVPVDKPPFVPVGRLALRKARGELELSVRLACFPIRDDGKLSEDVDGWRYEPAEDGNRAHCFPHVQRITAWKHKGKPGFWHEGYSRDGEAEGPASWVNECRPAFPLPRCSPPGLLVCVLLSLYGSEVVDEILEAATGLHGDLKREAAQITGR